jgi:hypothetical protein
MFALNSDVLYFKDDDHQKQIVKDFLFIAYELVPLFFVEIAIFSKISCEAKYSC